MLISSRTSQQLSHVGLRSIIDERAKLHCACFKDLTVLHDALDDLAI